MQNPVLWLGVAALALWVATAVLAVAYDGDGSPVGEGLALLSAIVVTLFFGNAWRRRRGSSSRGGSQP